MTPRRSPPGSAPGTPNPADPVTAPFENRDHAPSDPAFFFEHLRHAGEPGLATSALGAVGYSGAAARPGS